MVIYYNNVLQTETFKRCYSKNISNQFELPIIVKKKIIFNTHMPHNMKH